MVEGDRAEIPHNKQHMTLSSEPVGAMLTELHTAVRAALAPPQPTNTAPLRRNPKGDVQQSFDLTAELCAQGFLRRHEPHGLLLSEESGPLLLGQAPPKLRRPRQGGCDHTPALDPLRGAQAVAGLSRADDSA